MNNWVKQSLYGLLAVIVGASIVYSMVYIPQPDPKITEYNKLVDQYNTLVSEYNKDMVKVGEDYKFVFLNTDKTLKWMDGVEIKLHEYDAKLLALRSKTNSPELLKAVDDILELNHKKYGLFEDIRTLYNGTSNNEEPDYQSIVQEGKKI